MFPGSVPCRSCGGALAGVLDLGMQPLAGAFPPSGVKDGAVRPLRLAVCDACGLVQLADETVPETDLPDAPAPTSSATMEAHVRALVAALVEHGVAEPGARVASLASHGGHVWPFLRERGIDAMVLESSSMWAARLQAEGAEVAALDEADGGAFVAAFDLVVEHYLLAHRRRPDDLVARIATMLRPGGTLVMEFDHVLATIRGIQFDAIRHGHHVYLSLTWVQRSLARAGLTVTHAEPVAVYGGAVRIRAIRGPGDVDGMVTEILEEERSAGIDRAVGLAPFAAGVETIRERTRRYLVGRRAAGRSVLGYGAPARAVTFLNALDLGPELLPFTADRSRAKQGRDVPGTAIPVRSPAELEAAQPDEILVLAWDLADEVRRQLRGLEARGTRFVVAIPELAIVTEAGLVPIGPEATDL